MALVARMKGPALSPGLPFRAANSVDAPSTEKTLIL
jgi:hypothetical protein